MQVQGFIWLEQFVEKLLDKHSVNTGEVEELFNNYPNLAKPEPKR